MDRSPSFPFSVDEKRSPGDGIDALPKKALRGAVGASDAYQATRAAVRLEGATLRIGNRFLPVGRYREIAFLSAGHAAVSQALAVVQGLGARLTQGLVCGPDPAPPEVPFRSVRVPKGWPSSTTGVEAARLALELASGLGPDDLLLVLLSGGAVNSLALPSDGRTPNASARWLESLLASGASSREIALVEAIAFSGGVDGGIAEAAGAATVVPIVIDRGDGGALVGGSPTRRLTEPERAEALGFIERSGKPPGSGGDPVPFVPAPARSPLPPNIGRPVVVATPDDALRGAADAVGEKRFLPRLAERGYSGGPEAIALRLTERVEEILKAEASALTARDRDGLVVFATSTLGVPEGLDEGPAIRRFLSEAQPRLRHRGARVAAFATSGGTDPTNPAGGSVAAGGPDDHERRIQGVPMQPGVTDVGSLLLVVVPAPRP